MDPAETGNGLEIDSLPRPAWIGVLAALASGAVHLRLGLGNFPTPLGISFLLAGVGFIAAVVLVLIDYRRKTVYAVGLPFTIVQIAAWYYLNFAAGEKAFPADAGTLGLLDKVAQLLLVAVLLVLLR